MGPPRHPQPGEMEAGGAGGGRWLQVEMSSQQFPRLGTPSTGLSQAPSQIANSGSAGLINPAATVNDESSREAEVTAREHMGSSSSLQSREEKQEPVVVRPYPQVQMLSTHHAVASGTPVTVTAPPAHLTPAVPLSFSEGLMKGHPSNLHHIMTTNVQMSIIRSNAPGPPLHIGASHLPRGAAAAAVMSSSKVTTVLRPTSQLPNAATAQPAVQHIIHQPIQSRPPVTTSNTIPPAVVATVSATRAQSPVITTTAAHATDSALSRPTLSIQHPPSAAISIQRPAQSRDVTTRITLPSHPALGTPKQQLHTMAQKTIFSTGTPVAAATVAPILATNTIPSATTAGSVSHTQAPTSTIVTMTMPSHSSHATAVTTSNIPVAKVVPQQITHTSPRIQPDYPAERSSLIPISGHRASPNPVAMETRSDNRPSVPVQFQYFLPTYPPSAYPLAAHTYTPITSSVSTIRQYPVSAQAPNSAITAQTGVGVASTVHLNPMQLMTVDASHARHIQGIQPAPISTQGIQPAPIGTPGIQPAPMGTQGIHSATPISTQGLQPAPMGTQQPQPEGKTSAVVLADGATIVANPISNPFSAAPAPTTVVPTHSQSAGSSAPAQGSSPRPSILRKKPATDGMAVRKTLIPPQPPEVASPRVESSMRSTSGSPRPAGAKPKSEIHVSMATPVTVSMETVSSQNNDQPTIAVPPTAQQPPSTIPTMIAAASPPSQPAVALSTIPGAVPVTPPVTTIATAPPPSAAVAGSLSSVLGPPVPEIKVKEEVEPMDIMRPVSAVPPLATSTVSPSLALLANNLSMPTSDLPPGASPRKKPRKQQHVISTEEGDMMETNSTDDEKSTAKSLLVKAEKRKSPPKEYIDEEGVRYVPVRPRPPITLLRHYRNPWKAAYHHFQRYSDVRVKEEKKAMLQEIANQKGVSCRAQGWKVHLCAAQLLQLTNLEHDVYERLTNLQEGIIPKKKAATDDDLHRINELIQGNMQRCKLVMDQISEARDSMLKVLDHKDRVLKLLNKNGTVKKVSKLKRKEKV
ncbi:histone deacetylase complex subunit SAP130 isoform X4 [Canis lupus baileyi]|uniref:histone deacetylase complex subunit SAP130 isoform X5 n=1 Tax=Canis lupus familiaris TaxID=9615 RepID=UPI000DC685DD|nr:histone deacetylase complex subunit SAP130 isoform X5 [Canis lupus familiaris]XP_025291736.1 histone deacetylase complex subunit SAP130 isoform X5 [Canis lupus dingo]XP_038281848.1 histone deacetylase complex subunit SAP130 isoform X5 [Canis lupus familiaris]XP_038420745.1 histone deacetylase complex subunit SAP130 isoform X5 [Canis lupus familiaris]